VKFYRLDICLTCDHYKILQEEGGWVQHDPHSNVETQALFNCDGYCKRYPEQLRKDGLDYCGEYRQLKLGRKHLYNKWYNSTVETKAHLFNFLSQKWKEKVL